MSIVPCGCVSSTSSRTGRLQPVMLRADAAVRQARAGRTSCGRGSRSWRSAADGRHQLERRSWRIEPVSRAIQQRIRRACFRAGVRRPSGDASGHGIARAREQLAGVGIEHDRRRPARAPSRRSVATIGATRSWRSASIVRRTSRGWLRSATTRGMVRLVAMPQHRHELAVVAADRQHRPAGRVGRLHDRRVIVEAAQPIFGVALDVRRVRRAPVRRASARRRAGETRGRRADSSARRDPDTRRSSETPSLLRTPAARARSRADRRSRAAARAGRRSSRAGAAGRVEHARVVFEPAPAVGLDAEMRLRRRSRRRARPGC